MNKILLISLLTVLLFLGCKKDTGNHICSDCQILVVDQEKIINEQINVIAKLKERLKGAEWYIKTLEIEKDSLVSQMVNY